MIILPLKPETIWFFSNDSSANRDIIRFRPKLHRVKNLFRLFEIFCSDPQIGWKSRIFQTNRPTPMKIHPDFVKICKTSFKYHGPFVTPKMFPPKQDIAIMKQMHKHEVRGGLTRWGSKNNWCKKRKNKIFSLHQWKLHLPGWIVPCYDVTSCSPSTIFDPKTPAVWNVAM